MHPFELSSNLIRSNEGLGGAPRLAWYIQDWEGLRPGTRCSVSWGFEYFFWICWTELISLLAMLVCSWTCMFCPHKVLVKLYSKALLSVAGPLRRLRTCLYLIEWTLCTGFFFQVICWHLLLILLEHRAGIYFVLSSMTWPVHRHDTVKWERFVL